MRNKKSPFGHPKKDTDLHDKEGKDDVYRYSDATSPKERRFRVQKASDQYLKGEISEDKLQQIEDAFDINYKEATYGVVATPRGIRGWFKRVLGI